MFRPWYASLAQGGGGAGGLRDERREQNRARYVHRLGLDAAYWPQKVKPGHVFFLRASWQGLHDFHYYNARSQRHEDTVRLSEAWLSWCRGTSNSTCATPVFFLGANEPDAGRPFLGTPRKTQPSRQLSSKPSSSLEPSKDWPKQPGQRSLNWHFRIGRSLWAADTSGLFFTGESPLFYAGLQIPVAAKGASNRPSKFQLRMGVANIERENRARRGLPESRRIKARYYMLFGNWESQGLSIGFHYGFYRSPGRAAKPDWVFSAQLPEPFVAHRPGWKLPVGQSARDDADVHYYGIFPEWNAIDWQFRARLWHNYGRLLPVDEAGLRIRSGRKRVQGSLVWLELSRELGPKRFAGPCPITWIRRGGCLQGASQNRAWQIGFGGIYATRNRDSADGRLTGFGSLRPAVAVLGGGGSIFLTGPPPGIERPAFQNTQPQAPFSDGGRKGYLEPRQFRDNSDPAPPDYGNDGLRIGGLRASYLFAGRGRLRMQLFTNYAALRYGIGREAILSLAGGLASWLETYKSSHLCTFPKVRRGLFCSFRPQMEWQVFATSASYSPARRQIEPYSNISRRAPTRFYRRVQALLSFRF